MCWSICLSYKCEHETLTVEQCDYVRAKPGYKCKDQVERALNHTVRHPLPCPICRAAEFDDPASARRRSPSPATATAEFKKKRDDSPDTRQWKKEQVEAWWKAYKPAPPPEPGWMEMLPKMAPNGSIDEHELVKWYKSISHWRDRKELEEEEAAERKIAEQEAERKAREQSRPKPFSNRYWGPKEAKLYGLVSESGQPYGGPNSRVWGPKKFAKYGLNFEKYGSYMITNKPSRAGESANVPVLRDSGRPPRMDDLPMLRPRGEGAGGRRIREKEIVNRGMESSIELRHPTYSRGRRRTGSSGPEELYITYTKKDGTIVTTTVDYKGRCLLTTSFEARSANSHKGNPLRRRGPCANPHCGVTLARDWRHVDGQTFCDPCGKAYKKNGSYRPQAGHRGPPPKKTAAAQTTAAAAKESESESEGTESESEADERVYGTTGAVESKGTSSESEEAASGVEEAASESDEAASEFESVMNEIAPEIDEFAFESEESASETEENTSANTAAAAAAANASHPSSMNLQSLIKQNAADCAAATAARSNTPGCQPKDTVSTCHQIQASEGSPDQNSFTPVSRGRTHTSAMDELRYGTPTLSIRSKTPSSVGLQRQPTRSGRVSKPTWKARQSAEPLPPTTPRNANKRRRLNAQIERRRRVQNVQEESEEE